MNRKELSEKLLENIGSIDDQDEKVAWAEAFCNEVIDQYWNNHYLVRVSDPDLGSYPVCGLCGNTGVVHSKCLTPKGLPIDNKFFCICPNGQSLRKLGRDPTLSYCPTERDFKN